MVGPARDALRSMLNAMTLCDVRYQARFLERLRQTHPHTVKVLKSRVPLKRYTCGVYAFDLVGNADYAQIAGFGFGRTFAGAEFLHHLMDQRLLEPRTSGAAISGDLAIYFQDDKFVACRSIVGSAAGHFEVGNRASVRAQTVERAAQLRQRSSVLPGHQ